MNNNSGEFEIELTYMERELEFLSREMYLDRLRFEITIEILKMQIQLLEKAIR